MSLEKKKIGRITEYNRKVDFKWQIQNFFSFSDANSKYYSPEFPMLDCTWQIEIWPNFTSNDLNESYVSLYLCKINKKTPKSVKLIFSIMTARSTLENQKDKICTFTDQALGWSQFISRHTLTYSTNKEKFVPSGTLTIICTLIIESNQQDFIVRPDKLADDLKDLFDRKKNSDITLKINEDTISAHKSILAARSPVFGAMFENEMEEKRTGVVNIIDCDLDAFNAFLHYLYVGEAEFGKCDIFSLYKIADKYGVPELMMICVDFIIRNLSVENLCDSFLFANHVTEDKLLVHVQRFFNKNFGSIILSKPWQSLLKENDKLANELLKGMAPNITVTED